MSARQRNIAPYTQPAFIICALVLAIAGAGMSVATKRLGLYLKKEPLPLLKPLDALDEAKLAPYNVAAKYAIENEEILEALGTEDYLQWVFEDPGAPAPSSVRNVMVFITYYRLPDRVPHVPEECYTGGGYDRLATDAVALEVPGPDGSRRIPGRYLLFDKKTPDLSPTLHRFPVLYLFRVNGEYAGSRDEARLALNKNIFSKYAYFCKVELVFNQSAVAPAKREALAASERILAVLLPVLEQEHWPDRR